MADRAHEVRKGHVHGGQRPDRRLLLHRVARQDADAAAMMIACLIVSMLSNSITMFTRTFCWRGAVDRLADGQPPDRTPRTAPCQLGRCHHTPLGRR